MCGTVAAAPFTLSAGAGYVTIVGGQYDPYLRPVRVHEDKGTWFPYVTADVRLSDVVSVRVGYQYLGGFDTYALYLNPDPSIGTNQPEFFTNRYESDIHVVTLSPVLRWKIMQGTRGFLAPEVNWVAHGGKTRAVLPTGLGPPWDRHEYGYTPGGTIGVQHEFTRRWGIEVAYRYADLKPAWSRKAHEFMLAVTIR